MKGATTFGIASITAEIIKAILQDDNRILPVSAMLHGEYGEEDVYMGVPAVLGAAADQNITRAEVMTLVNRLLERAVDQDGMLDDMVKWSDNQPDAWYYETVQEATNSHNYSRDEGETVETWTEITPPRDWSELEK